MTHSRKHAPDQKIRRDGGRAIYRSRAHDLQNIYVSLKQWRIFHAVIDCGGFAEAAKTLHLSQSTISYTVAKLQEQLGTTLLKTEGRKAALTVEGRALLERSRHVLKEAIELETFARNLGQGWGGDVRLMVDHSFPSTLLMRALGYFSQAGRGAAQVRLSEVATLQAEDMLRDTTVDLAITGRVPLGFLGEPLLEVEYVPVAHPDHPLLHLGRDVTSADLGQQTQIGIGHPQERERGGSGLQRWLMSSIDSVLEAVSECLGYAWLPQHRIQRWLDDGRLVRLPLGDKRVNKSMLYLIHGRPWAASPAAGRLADVLRSTAVAAHHDADRSG
ncbi:MAG TPA: LysR family transcriptional regulator [Noviherbaspirillum sp.]|uniref:LysR family transcriptional regulator n=1 Tax=Noviherbaspirillum sp. TaxID=1926288 RepID=UPI002B468EB2|nr:LysR family transcriptional regulator [Noviherbaspirillum sp.]HJV87332.1 LysR family transcriptional regulator [Noviherbaspirillum sp.]